MFTSALIAQWANKWGVPIEAFTELAGLLGAGPRVKPEHGMSESAVLTRLRLRGSQQGLTLLRNNSGAAEGADGRQIRFGLGNDSAKINKHSKSSDLIGITPTLITKEMVGKVIGQFTAIEAKRGDWCYTGKAREVAQLNFILLVASLGGLATFLRSEEDLTWTSGL